MLRRIALEMQKFILSLGPLGVAKLRLSIFIVCLPSLLVLPQVISAQGPEVDVLRVSTDLVVYPIRVKDKNNGNVRNLSDRDLQLKDNDGIISSVYLASGAERVAMVFAIDESGSLRDVIAKQRDTALALFSRFKGNSKIAVFRFGQSSKLAAPFDASPEQARAAFTLPAVRNQRTAIFDAAAEVIKVFDSTVKDPVERRIVILISDGLDNASGVKAASVIDRALENNVSFYVIHIPIFEPREGHLTVRLPSKGFRDLAEKTGGGYFLVGEKSPFVQETIDLTPVFQAIEADLKNQYLLGFYLGEQARDGRRHQVSITLLPMGLAYSLPGQGFSKTHRFAVNLPPRPVVPEQPDR